MFPGKLSSMRLPPFPFRALNLSLSPLPFRARSFSSRPGPQGYKLLPNRPNLWAYGGAAAFIGVAAFTLTDWRLPHPKRLLYRNDAEPSKLVANEQHDRVLSVTEAEDLYRESSIPAVKHRMGVQSGKKFSYEHLKPEVVTEILRRNEESVSVGTGLGVVRYDITQIPCNDPIEDDHSERTVRAPPASNDLVSGQWMFWGIYDGHSGWGTAAKLRQSLVSYVYSKLVDIYATSHAAGSPLPHEDQVAAAIKTAFLDLDHDIVWSNLEKVQASTSKQTAAQLLAPAISGSCALLGFYETKSQLLRIACTGDSRAVLGRRTDQDTWSAIPLSTDQTADNPDEVARILSEHPGEEGAVKNGRVLGQLQPSRAFGDADFKWPLKTSLSLRKTSFARKPPNGVTTPPYVTAEPVITTTKIRPENGDFVVMASDGLWEMLSNEEVVSLVGRWIERGLCRQCTTPPDKLNFTERMWARFSSSSVWKSPAPAEAAPFGKPPHRPKQWQLSTKRRAFLFKDDNAATHLARNAFGADNEDLQASLFMLTGQNARRFRDDLTISVIFFGNKEDGNSRTTN